MNALYLHLSGQEQVKLNLHGRGGVLDKLDTLLLTTIRFLQNLVILSRSKVRTYFAVYSCIVDQSKVSCHHSYPRIQSQRKKISALDGSDQNIFVKFKLLLTSHPNPLDLPVSAFFMTTQSMTSPKREKYRSKLSCVVSQLKK